MRDAGAEVERTRETTCIASSCQCQTSPGTDGTGAHGQEPAASGRLAGHRLPLASAPRAGPDRVPVGPILTDAPRAAKGGQLGAARATVRVEDLLRELSRVVLVDRSLADVLTDVTAIAAQGIPGAEATSITLIRDDKPFTVAHFGEMALAADELQYEHGFGPCMDAGRGGVLLRVDDMRTEQRWPDYVAHVLRRRRCAVRCRSRCPTRARPSAR